MTITRRYFTNQLGSEAHAENIHTAQEAGTVYAHQGIDERDIPFDETDPLYDPRETDNTLYAEGWLLSQIDPTDEPTSGGNTRELTYRPLVGNQSFTITVTAVLNAQYQLYWFNPEGTPEAETLQYILNITVAGAIDADGEAQQIQTAIDNDPTFSSLFTTSILNNVITLTRTGATRGVIDAPVNPLGNLTFAGETFYPVQTNTFYDLDLLQEVISSDESPVKVIFDWDNEPADFIGSLTLPPNSTLAGTNDTEKTVIFNEGASISGFTFMENFSMRFDGTTAPFDLAEETRLTIDNCGFSNIGAGAIFNCLPNGGNVFVNMIDSSTGFGSNPIFTVTNGELGIVALRNTSISDGTIDGDGTAQVNIEQDSNSLIFITSISGGASLNIDLLSGANRVSIDDSTLSYTAANVQEALEASDIMADGVTFPDGSRQFTASLPDVYSRDINTFAYPRFWEPTTGDVTGFSFADNGFRALLINAGVLRSFQLTERYRAETGVEDTNTLTPGLGTTQFAVFVNNGNRVIIGTQAIANGLAQYDLGTPYDLGTAGAPTIVSDVVEMWDAYLKVDGKTLLTVDSNQIIQEVTLPNAFDITGATVTNSWDISAFVTGNLRAITLTEDGKRAFVAQQGTAVIRQWELSNGFSFDSIIESGTNEELGFVQVRGAELAGDGRNLNFALAGGNDEVAIFDFGISVDGTVLENGSALEKLFIYRPDGVKEGNVYTNQNDLVGALEQSLSPVTLILDWSVAVIAGLNPNLTNVPKFSTIKGVNQIDEVTFSTGSNGNFRSFTNIENIKATHNSGSSAPFLWDETITGYVKDSTLTTSNRELFQLRPNGNSMSVYFDNVTFTGNLDVINIQNGTFNLYFTNNCTLTTEVIDGDGTATLNLYFDSTVDVSLIPDTLISGAIVNKIPLSSAESTSVDDSVLSYTAANVQEALEASDIATNGITFPDESTQYLAVNPFTGRGGLNNSSFGTNTSGITSARGGFVSIDGSYLLVMDISSATVELYDLTTPKDLSTAVLNSTYLEANFGFKESAWLNPTGDRLYILPQNGGVVQYDLGTPYDLTTVGAANQNSITLTNKRDMHFSPDGKFLFLITTSNILEKYFLSTAWDITTQNFVSTLNISSLIGVSQGLSFSSDGRLFYVTDDSTNDVVQYYLSTPWKVDVLSEFNLVSTTQTNVSTPKDIFISRELDILYIFAESNGVLSKKIATQFTGKVVSEERHLIPSAIETIIINNASDLDSLASAGVYTLTQDTLIIYNESFSSNTRIELNGFSLTINNLNQLSSKFWTYTGGLSLFNGSGNLRFSWGVSFSGNFTGTLFNLNGRGQSATVVIGLENEFIQFASLGTIIDMGYLLTNPFYLLVSQGVTLIDVGLIFVSNPVLIASTITLLDVSGVDDSDIEFKISDGNSTSSPSVRFARIDPACNNLRALLSNITTTASSLFDTTETKNGTWSSPTNASFTGATITSVTDSSGNARFNIGVVPETLYIGQRLQLQGFSESSYNETYTIRNTDGSTYFEFADNLIAFVSDDTGTFDSDVTEFSYVDSAGVLADGDTIFLDGTQNTEYDIGSEIYNVGGGTFRANTSFITGTPTGTYSDAGLDQTNPSVTAQNNPGLPSSLVVGYGSVNANATVTTVADGVYGDVNFTGFNFQTEERFKLIDQVAGVWEVTSNEPVTGQVDLRIWPIKAGSNQDYRLVLSINDNVPVFASEPYAPMEVQSVKTHATALFPFTNLVKGDTLQIKVAGDGTTASLTFTDVQMELRG